MGDAELTDVAVELYALTPGEFTAARNARAKQLRAAGDRELAGRVQALRKPTAAAWAVNLLVRHRPQEVEGLLALGGRLLEAQAALKGETLRELNRQQHQLMAAVRDQAGALAADAGQRLSDTVDAQVEGTLRAAMADPQAAEAVRTGLLVTELVSTGFEPVDVGDAVAVPGAPPLAGTAPAAPSRPVGGQEAAPQETVPLPRRSAKAGRSGRASDQRAPAAAQAPATTTRTAGRRRREDAVQPDAEAADRAAARAKQEAERVAVREAARRRELQEAERDVAEAASQAEAAAAELRAAEATAAELAGRHGDLAREIEELTTRIRELRDEQTATSVQERHAQKARDVAARTADAAARRARAARQRLDRLR